MHVFQGILRAAVADVVRHQSELGIDVPGDGELGKSVSHRVSYGAWWNYAFRRLGGLELGGPALDSRPPQRSRPGEIALTSAANRRDRVRFAAAYADRESGIWMGPRPTSGPVCVGPLTYSGHAEIAADIANFKAALKAAGVEEGFMTAVAPGSAYRIPNEYYKSDEEFLYACAEALREEYKAILDAGLILQLDDPATATGWDMIDPEPAVEDYKKFTMVRVEALNHALRGLPQDRIRFHLCWGSWHGPHTTDIPMRDLVDLMLAVNAGAYSFEATPPTSSSIPSSSPTASCVLPTWSAGSGSSLRPIAVSAAASTPTLLGPSSKRWSRAPRSPLASAGVEGES